MKSIKDLCIVSLGDLVADLNVTISDLPVMPQQHQIVQNIQLEPGGAGNFLLAGARLGAQMISLGVIGDDLYGQEMLKVFKEEGIEVEDVIVQGDGNTTLVFVLVDRHGQHVFLGQVGIGPMVGLSEDWKKAIDRADGVQSYGYTLQEERLSQTLLDGMAYALDRGKPVFFDPGPYVRDIPFEVRLNALRRCSVVLLTEEEIPLVVPGGVDISDAPKLLSENVKLVVVKLGREGSVAFTEKGNVSHPGFKVPVVDTTAAGDSFAAAFMIAWLQERPLIESLTIANAMGAAKVQKLGSGRQVPTLKEVHKVLNGSVNL